MPYNRMPKEDATDPLKSNAIDVLEVMYRDLWDGINNHLPMEYLNDKHKLVVLAIKNVRTNAMQLEHYANSSFLPRGEYVITTASCVKNSVEEACQPLLNALKDIIGRYDPYTDYGSRHLISAAEDAIKKFNKLWGQK